MSAVIHLPDPIRLRAGMAAVRQRAQVLHVTRDQCSTALATLLREMQAGRSTAAAVALANGALRRNAPRVQGGAA